MAVGYQDDSFVVYSILQGFKPLYRGFEHRSFICQIKFDNFHMRKQLEMLHKKNKKVEDVENENLLVGEGE